MSVATWNNGKRRTVLDVEPTDTVGDIQRRIQDRYSGTPIILVFNGRVLWPEYQLQEYSIQKDCTIFVAQALRG